MKTYIELEETVAEIIAVANDINAYLKHASVPMECNPSDVDNKLTAMIGRLRTKAAQSKKVVFVHE